MQVKFFNMPYIIYACDIYHVQPPTKAHVIRWDQDVRNQSNAVVVVSRNES